MVLAALSLELIAWTLKRVNAAVNIVARPAVYFGRGESMLLLLPAGGNYYDVDKSAIDFNAFNFLFTFGIVLGGGPE